MNIWIRWFPNVSSEEVIKSKKRMKSQNYFKVGSNGISYISSNFKDNFMDIEFEIPKVELKTKKLERNMTDKEILTELKPQESNLGELAYALENNLLDKENYNINIFYIRDKNNALWAVDARWDSDSRCWDVDANSVEDPDDWHAGRQVVSRDFNFEPMKSNESLTLNPYDTVKITEIEWKLKPNQQKV